MNGQAPPPPLQWPARLANRRLRWIGYALAACILAIACIYPRPYVARAKIVPGDAGANGLVSVLGALGGGQGQNLASLFGDRGATEVALQLSRSDAVAGDVIARLKLAGPGAPYASDREARLALAKKVDIHTLLGGIIEVETKLTDPDLALRITETFVTAIGERLGTYGKTQVARKRRIVNERLAKAQVNLAARQAALDVFRRQNQLADPQAQLGSQLALRTGLEGQLQATQVELATLRMLVGPENLRLIAAQRKAATLRQQIAGTAAASVSAAGPTVGELTGISLRYANLYRDFIFAQTIYEVYSRSAEEVAVQEMVSQDRSQISIIDTPHVDAERYFNTWAVASLALLILLALFLELYAPATGLLASGRANLHEAEE